MYLVELKHKLQFFVRVAYLIDDNWTNLISDKWLLNSTRETTEFLNIERYTLMKQKILRE